MLKVLIIEDEDPSAKRLAKMIVEIEAAVEIAATIVSVSSSVKWLKENPVPDLIFSDIQLSDGISFEIFKAVDIACPVIFITAFDQYAIDAFKVNSIDYLLKPVKKNELEQAILKFKKIKQEPQPAFNINKLLQAYEPQQHAYKKRFIVRYSEHIKTINTEDIAYFYTEDKVNFLTSMEGRRFIVDFNLDTLDTMLDPLNFFRINRQFIISITAIEEMFAYTKSRVLVKLKPPTKHETIVSTERSADFKAWLGDGS
ncbi:LytTR family DNA-binding domain-containing protein [soil metagenome]